MNFLFYKDFYKVDHINQYPKGTNLIFSNFTPRKSRLPGINHSVFMGLKYFIKDVLLVNPSNQWGSLDNHHYHQIVKECLGKTEFMFHIENLFEMEYLPIEIYALPEKSVVPCGVPALVMFNSDPRYFWLPGMLETLMSYTLWGSCTAATIARQFRLILDEYAALTSDIPEFVDYQAHDFSYRGMMGVEAAIQAGLAHLQYFKGTDNITALMVNKKYNHVDYHPASIPATEHSVMSSYGKENEFDTFKHLITQVYPSGNISIVSDTWDLWNVIENYLPRLKDIIMARNGKVVIRPDSGDPADIICGAYNNGRMSKSELKGTIELLWDIFGGTINSKGYKQLDPHIGAIYGDGITLERCKEICKRLKAKGFASTNIVFGIGSYSYGYHSRDTLGWAMKSTYCEVDGIGRAITKDPITDDGTKKSHSGILKVIRQDGEYKVLQNQTWGQFHLHDNELKLVYKDGKSYI